jgi:excinuclease UvrABC ATPase subunit
MDYLRVLFARIGDVPLSPSAGAKCALRALTNHGSDRDLTGRHTFPGIVAVAQQRKGTHTDLLAQERQQGYRRARIDGVTVRFCRIPSSWQKPKSIRLN